MSQSKSSSTDRTVVGIIDAGSTYSSTIAAAGGYVFFGGTAIDESGNLAPEALPAEPYSGSAAAQAEAQGNYLFESFDQLLPKVGSSVADIVQIEQYVRLKVHADAYFRAATSKKYLGKAVPVAATAQVGSYAPADAAVAVTGLAIVPDTAAGLVKSEPEDPTGAASANRKFSELIFAGPYIFTTIFPSNRKSGLPDQARTPDWIWSGSEIGAEMKWGLEELRSRLENVGATLADIVDYTVFLTDAGDLYEFDLAMRAAVGDNAPSRTVIPSLGYALPRREGAFGHEQGAPRMEVQFRIRRPGVGADKEVIEGPGAGFGYQSAAVRLGPLVWISSQVSAPEHRGNTKAEIDDILAKVAETCRNAGTDLSNALRVRVLLARGEDAATFSDALRTAIPNDPPTVCIAVLHGPLPTPNATVAIDVVVYARN